MNIGFKIAATAAAVMLLLFCISYFENGRDAGPFPDKVRSCLGGISVVTLLSLVGGFIAGVWLS